MADLDHFPRFLLDRLLREDCVTNVNSSEVLRASTPELRRIARLATNGFRGALGF
ncbi:MAG: hypothetical protein IT467_01500 [Dokdonella sp.]|uniref:hypothetical protein n=1 Tax=Dokdonella sp. TaxID=2291710 RepID=UPI0025C084B9|nr:hypothetical protein [Dokdonella sp.]MBZ0222459.1 Lrp/AsnC ligand binding domain-containing protein [Dokdonella sp.]MCC7254582.1 hypothetical protein [Dokdonella sp.]